MTEQIINVGLTKEVFLQEFNKLLSNNVDAIDAMVTIAHRYGIEEESMKKYVDERVMSILKHEAMKQNFIKKTEETTIDDFF